MKRDGQLESIWQSEGKHYGQENLAADARFDVVIAGAGITGITCALMLQKKGVKCILVEASNMGFGTSGGTTAHLNSFGIAIAKIVDKLLQRHAEFQLVDAWNGRIARNRKHFGTTRVLYTQVTELIGSIFKDGKGVSQGLHIIDHRWHLLITTGGGKRRFRPLRP